MPLHAELEGKVKLENSTTRKRDAGVHRNIRTGVRKEAYADVYIEIQEGHPNLDEWSSENRVKPLSSLAKREGSFVAWTPVEGTWSIEIHGNSAEWVPTLIEYLAERPDDSLADVLKRFLNLTDVSNTGLSHFSTNRTEVRHFDTRSGDLTGEEWDELVADIEKVGEK